MVRDLADPVDRDRGLHAEVEAVSRRIRAGEIARAAEAALSAPLD